MSKTNLKPGSLPFSKFETPLLHRLQKHILSCCSQKRMREEKPVTIFLHQRYKAVLHKVWKWILDTQGLSSTVRQDQRPTIISLMKKCGEYSRLFKRSISDHRGFYQFCEILWNTTPALKTSESPSYEYSSDDPSTHQWLGQHWHM